MNKILLLTLVLFLAVFSGCGDPNEAQLDKGKNIDLERTTGTITSKSVRYFEGNQDWTKERKGLPYYCLTISTTNQNNSTTSEEFIGVPVEKFDFVEVGMELSSTILNSDMLAKINGKIVDMQADMSRRQFFIAVEQTDRIKIYRVCPEVYYRKIKQ